MPGLNGRPSEQGPPPRAIPALSGGAAAPALREILAFEPRINKKLPSTTLPQHMNHARSVQAQCLDAAAAANKDLCSGADRNGRIGELLGVFGENLGNLPGSVGKYAHYLGGGACDDGVDFSRAYQRRT